MTIRNIGCRLVLVLAICLLASRGWGKETNHWLDEDKAKFSIGSFITDYDSEFRLTSSRFGRGTTISFEDDLGLEESNTVIRLDGHYRFAARHRVEFSYFDLSRDGKTISTRPLLIEDTLFRRGSNLDTTFDYQILKFAYAYSFWQSGKFDLSTSAGLYTFDLGISVESDDGKEESEEGTAPFPMFGLHLDYRLGEDIYLLSSFEYFFVDEDDFEGELTDANIALEYRPFENLGFGLGYNAVTIFTEATDDDDDDKFDYEYNGILLYLSWNY
jgi:hypothetical protein